MDRQRIIETNRSLRNIKNELESLLEKGILGDAAFDAIISNLPAESSLSSASTIPAPAAAPFAATPSLPVRKKTSELAPSSSPDLKPGPPAYSQTVPPALPSRSQPPAPPAPSKPVLAQARALYQYQGSDSRDVSFEKDDVIAVHEYMNADWWMGRNLRTGEEGIFPKSYVLVEEGEKSAAGYGSQGVGPGPSAPVNPYNTHVPPMAIANGGERDSVGKVNDNGKKFGKKLGNAAIFGAGATIGGKIVNGIF